MHAFYHLEWCLTRETSPRNRYDWDLNPDLEMLTLTNPVVEYLHINFIVKALYSLSYCHISG